jgi:hypothetical protein
LVLSAADADAEQLARLDLVEFACFMAVQHAPEIDHSHTLTAFRPAHLGSPTSPDVTRQICVT